MKKKLLFTLLMSTTLYSQEPVNPGLQRYLTRIAAETAEIPNQLPEQGISNLLETARDKLKEARTYKEYRSFLTRAPQLLQETLAENPQHAGNPEINIFVRCIFNLFGEINSHLPRTDEPFKGEEKDTILQTFRIHELKIIPQELAPIPE